MRDRRVCNHAIFAFREEDLQHMLEKVRVENLEQLIYEPIPTIIRFLKNSAWS